MLNRWVQVKEVRKLVSWRERCNVHTIVLQFSYWCIFRVLISTILLTRFVTRLIPCYVILIQDGNRLMKE